MPNYRSYLAASAIAVSALITLQTFVAHSEPLTISTEKLQSFARESGASRAEVAAIASDSAKTVVWSARYESVYGVQEVIRLGYIRDFSQPTSLIVDRSQNMTADHIVERALHATRTSLNGQLSDLVFPEIIPIVDDLLIRVVNGEDLRKAKLTSVQRTFLWELLRALHNGSGIVGDGRGVFAVRSSDDLNQKLGWKLPAEVFDVVSQSTGMTHVNIWGRSLASLNRYVLAIQNQAAVNVIVRLIESGRLTEAQGQRVLEAISNTPDAQGRTGYVDIKNPELTKKHQPVRIEQVANYFRYAASHADLLSVQAVLKDMKVSGAIRANGAAKGLCQALFASL